jgi:hypothetical protein
MLLADIIDAVTTDLATVQSGVTSKLGARFSASNVELVPRLVWVPQTETFDAPWNNGENPRQLYSRLARCIVHIQGGDTGRTGDLGPTEALLHNLVASIYRVCHGYVTLGIGTWQSEDGTTTSASPLYLLEVTFGIPITDQAIDTATVTSIEQTNVTVFPDGDETDSVINTPPLP